jgi:Na+-transporting methylmalonyl-CoA/oxaloacetate decarboxylase gamma subunit
MDFDGPGFGPWGGWWHVATLVLGCFVWLLGVALMLAVVFFLIRFLLVATKAAQLYVNQHAPAEPARDTTSGTKGSTATAAMPASTTATTTRTPTGATTATTKPAPRPRTPRTPPASGTPAP